MCDLDDFDGETCDVWTNTWHTCRKPKPCASCKQQIPPKDRYLRHFDVYDGDVNVEVLCSVCGEAAESFQREHRVMPQSPAGIRYVLRDCIDNGDDASRARWQPILDTLDARRKAARDKTS